MVPVANISAGFPASMKVFRISGRDAVPLLYPSIALLASMKVFRISGRDVLLVLSAAPSQSGLNESLPHKRKRPGGFCKCGPHR